MGGVKCERVETMFNQELTPIEPRPNVILFNPLHCYKKFIHAAGDHHWSRQNIRLVRTELIDKSYFGPASFIAILPAFASFISDIKHCLGSLIRVQLSFRF